MTVDERVPPQKSRGILTDIRYFFCHKPPVPTLIKFNDPEQRENYCRRIIQRLGISVDKYSVLNIHRIGIDAPVRYVFEELLNWDGDSTCWPNHLATVERLRGSLGQIEIFLGGRKKYPLGCTKSFLGLKFIPLFKLHAMHIRHVPSPSDFDNARYLLYECSGGYPIGIFALYARSPIADQGETEPTQLFLVVGFNFYGKENWSGRPFFNRLWKIIHNRVTANILNRFKQLCEWRFEKVCKGHFQAE